MASERSIRSAAFSLITAFFLFFTFVPADSAKAEAPPDSSVEVLAGYRADDFSWNIAGNSSGGNPDILSELTWKDLGIFELRGIYRNEFRNNFYLKGSLGYGAIFRGDNQDSDYNGNGRTQEFSRSNNKADTGSVWDTSLGLGYRFNYSVSNGTLDFIPMAGYAFYQQNLKITDGNQTIPATGPFGGLHSSYTARWFGPWLGAEAAYRSGRFSLKGGLEYHIVGYSATADWNLRTNLQHPDSFDHSATGHGIVAVAGVEYALSKEWSFDANVNMHRFRASNGTDTSNLANGSTSTTKLNEVKWDSAGIMAGVKYSF